MGKPIVPPSPRSCTCELCTLKNKVEHLQATVDNLRVSLYNIIQFSTDDEAVKGRELDS